MRSMRSVLPLPVLSLLCAACGGKGTPAAQPPANHGAGAGATSTLGGPATLAPGEPALGCFAWSARTHTAACITGERSSTAKEQQLAFVGGDEPGVAIGDAIDDAAAAAASAALARDGFALLVGDATAAVPGQANDVTPGVSLWWERTQTDAGGDNVAPTHRNVVVARCGGQELPIFELELEGHEVAVRYRALPSHVIVEVGVEIAREGEYGEALEARVIDAGACAVAASP